MKIIKVSDLFGTVDYQSLSGVAIKFGSVGIAFIASLIYARALGPKEYGYYALLSSWMVLFQLICGLGLSEYIAREVSKTGSKNAAFFLVEWSQARIFVIFFLFLLLLVPVTVIGVLDFPYSSLIFIAIVIAGFSLFARIRLAALRGLGYIVISQFLHFLFVPVVMLIALMACWLFVGSLDAFLALSSMLIATICWVFVIEVLFRRTVSPGRVTDYLGKHSLSASLPFLMLAGLNFFNVRLDQLVIGYYMQPESVGIYSLAARVSEVAMFIAIGFEFTLGPRVARLFHEKEIFKLQRIIRSAIRLIYFLTLIMTIPMLILAEPLMGFVFGSEYVAGSTVLRILLLGNLLRFLFGPSALILNMTGFAAESTKILLCCVFTNLILNLILVPMVGIDGAAIATAFSYVLGAIILSRTAMNLTGIRAGVF